MLGWIGGRKGNLRFCCLSRWLMPFAETGQTWEGKNVKESILFVQFWICKIPILLDFQEETI